MQFFWGVWEICILDRWEFVDKCPEMGRHDETIMMAKTNNISKNDYNHHQSYQGSRSEWPWWQKWFTIVIKWHFCIVIKVKPRREWWQEEAGNSPTYVPPPFLHGTLCTVCIVYIVYIVNWTLYLCTSYTDTYVPPPFVHGTLCTSYTLRIVHIIYIVHCAHRIQTLISHHPSYMGHLHIVYIVHWTLCIVLCIVYRHLSPTNLLIM